MVQLKDVQKYVEAGLIVLEIRSGFGNDSALKAPKDKDWQRTPYRKSLPKSLYSSNRFGWLLKDEHLVIDIDPRNYSKDVDSLAELSKNVGFDLFTECTTIVKTGGGGWHFYFQKPKGLKVKETIKSLPGVEFKTKGRQVIAAGSMHPSTKAFYEFTDFSLPPGNMNDAPSSLLKLIEKKNEFTLSEGLNYYTNHLKDIDNCRRALKRLGPAKQGENGDNKTFRAAAIGHDFGLSPQTFLPLMQDWNDKCEPSWAEDELVRKIDNAYKYAQNNLGNRSVEKAFSDNNIKPENWRDNLSYNKEGGLKSNFNNLILTMTYEDKFKKLFGHNEFTDDTVIMKQPFWLDPTKGFKAEKVFDDDDAIHLKTYFATMGLEYSINTIFEAVRQVCTINQYHPVRDYFKSLEWDGKPRLNKWLSTYLGVEDTSYTNTVGAKTLIAAVKRIFEPGCKFDYILILEGKQGVGKSTALSILGHPWFSDTMYGISDSEAIYLMKGRLLIELSEMESFKRQDINAQKAFITRTVDIMRPKYGRTTKEFPRQCIMIATSNDVILPDSTGNRRFWPVKVGNVNFDLLQQDKNQLWAEAVHLYKKGEKIYIEDKQVEEQALLEQGNRQMNDAWEDTVSEWIFKNDIDRATTNDVWSDCFNRDISNITRSDQSRIGAILLKFGFEKSTFRDDKKIVKGYKKLLA